MKTAFVIFDLNTFNFQTFYLVSQSYKALASERILYFISPIYLQFIVNYLFSDVKGKAVFDPLELSN